MSAETYVYIIQQDQRHAKAPVKIGVARDVPARIAELQVGNPCLLVARMVFGPMTAAAAYELEAHMHRRFAKQGIRGEWFSGKILGMITLRENGYPNTMRGTP